MRYSKIITLVLTTIVLGQVFVFVNISSGGSWYADPLPVSDTIYNTAVDIVYTSLTTNDTHLLVNDISFLVTPSPTATCYINFTIIGLTPSVTLGETIIAWTEEDTLGGPVNYRIYGLIPDHTYGIFFDFDEIGYELNTTEDGILIFDGGVGTSNSYFIFGERGSLGIGTYYVAKTGNDITGTGTSSLPYASIQKAMNNSDCVVIYLKPGDYSNIYENIAGVTSGWEIKHNNFYIGSDPLTLPTKAILNGKTIAFTGAYGILTVGRLATHYNHVTIENLVIRNSTETGISLFTESTNIGNSNVIISKVDFYNISDNAIYCTDSTSGYTDGLYIKNCTFSHIQHSGSTGECITMKCTKNYVFEYNTISDSTKQLLNPGSYGIIRKNTFTGVDYYGVKIDPNAIGTYDAGKIHDIDIYDNKFLGTGYGHLLIQPEVNGDEVYNINIYNNIFKVGLYGSATNGISISGGSGATTPYIHDIVVKFNTVYVYNGATSRCLNIQDGHCIFSNIVIANNVFVSGGTVASQVSVGMVKTNPYTHFYSNLYYAYNISTVGCVYDDGTLNEAGSKLLNPLFTSLVTVDYSILSNSPARGNGSSSYTIGFDYLSIYRPQGGSYDIGAYEYDEEEQPYTPPPIPPPAPNTDPTTPYAPSTQDVWISVIVRVCVVLGIFIGLTWYFLL